MVRTSIRMCCTQNLNVYSKNRKNLYSPRFLRLYYVCIISKTKYISELQTAQCQQQMDGDRHVQTGENIPPTQSIRKTHIHPIPFIWTHPSIHPSLRYTISSQKYHSMASALYSIRIHASMMFVGKCTWNWPKAYQRRCRGLGAGECVDSS